MASGAWGRSPAWGTAPTAQVLIPSFEDVMKEQERERENNPEQSRGTSSRSSSKRSADAWLASEPWYPGKVNRDKKKIKAPEGQGKQKPSFAHPDDGICEITPGPMNHEKRYGITVVNLHKQDLLQSGYTDLLEWSKNPDNVYIGRDMTRFVPGAVGSKWQNPFKSKKIGRENSVKQYKEYILTDKTVQGNGKTLFESLGELKGKNLGCWCHPERCHGHILQELVEQYYQ